MGVVVLPLTFVRLVRVFAVDGWWRFAGGRWGCGGADRSGLVRPLRAGGPQAASNRFIHSVWRCQPSGRCTVMCPRPWRAVRAATSMRSRRSVAPRALAKARLARDPAARSRLWRWRRRPARPRSRGTSRRAGVPGGRRSRSAKTCSTMGVVAVLLLGLKQGERGVGEHGVVAPGGEQLVLAGGGRAVKVTDPADDQPGGDGLPLLRGERGVVRLGHLGIGSPSRRSWSSQIARG